MLYSTGRWHRASISINQVDILTEIHTWFSHKYVVQYPSCTVPGEDVDWLTLWCDCQYPCYIQCSTEKWHRERQYRSTKSKRLRIFFFECVVQFFFPSMLCSTGNDIDCVPRDATVNIKHDGWTVDINTSLYIWYQYMNIYQYIYT